MNIRYTVNRSIAKSIVKQTRYAFRTYEMQSFTILLAMPMRCNRVVHQARAAAQVGVRLRVRLRVCVCVCVCVCLTFVCDHLSLHRGRRKRRRRRRREWRGVYTRGGRVALASDTSRGKETNPRNELSSSVLPSASKTRSSFTRLSPLYKLVSPGPAKNRRQATVSRQLRRLCTTASDTHG